MDKEIIRRDSVDEADFLYEKRIRDFYPDIKEREVYTRKFAERLLEIINGEIRESTK